MTRRRGPGASWTAHSSSLWMCISCLMWMQSAVAQPPSLTAVGHCRPRGSVGLPACAHLNSHTSTCIPRAYACLLYPSCPQHCCLSFCPAHLLSPSLDAHTATRAALQHGCVVLHVNAHTACVSTVIRPSISTFLSSSRLPCAIPSLSSLLSRVLTHASGGRGCPAHRTQLVLLVS